LSAEFDFFSRDYRYDVNTELLSTPISEWEKVCKCNMPLNPNLFFIGCEECKKWFHPKCVGLSNQDAEKIESYLCDACKPPIVEVPHSLLASTAPQI